MAIEESIDRLASGLENLATAIIRMARVMDGVHLAGHEDTPAAEPADKADKADKAGKADKAKPGGAKAGKAKDEAPPAEKSNEEKFQVLRAAFVKLDLSEGKALVESFGHAKLSQIPADRYDEVAEKLGVTW